jgi:hypothetical protein
MEHLDIATKQLDRILSFFARVEAKASFVFAANSTILALVALNFRLEDFSKWQVTIPAVITVIGISLSIIFVYRCSFPNLAGGHDSLIYFTQIAKRREADYVDQFLQVDQKHFIKDILGQVWRNSEILTEKFRAIKVAFILTALSLFPFFLFLIAATVNHPQMFVVK